MQFALPDAGRILGAFVALLSVASALLVGAGWTLRRLTVLLKQKVAAWRSSGGSGE